MPFNDPNQPKRLVLQMSEKRHKALKMLALILDTTMDKLVNSLIDEKIGNKNLFYSLGKKPKNSS